MWEEIIVPSLGWKGKNLGLIVTYMECGKFNVGSLGNVENCGNTCGKDMGS